MGWKKKEKPLTQEEAIALAKKELTPFWLGSEPLFAGVRVGSQAHVYPLSREFEKGSWLMFFVNPVNFTGEAVLAHTQEWYQRYHTLGLMTLVIFKPLYPFLRSVNMIMKIFEKQVFPFIVVIDTDGTLTDAFSGNILPKILLINQQKQIFTCEGKGWLKGTETQIQQFLRTKDPGLPLLPEYKSSKQLICDVQQIHFANVPLSLEHSSTLKPGDYFIRGIWTQEEGRILTADPNASIGFHSPTSWVSIVAQSLSKIAEPSEIVVELNEHPVYDAVAGENILISDTGESILKVQNGQNYHLLCNLPVKQGREVILRFPNANKNSIALYELLFGEVLE